MNASLLRLVLLALLALGVPLFSQPLVFDAASVVVNKEPGRPGTVGTVMQVNPNGITFTEVSLMTCIAAVYGVTSYQIRGPEWLRRGEWYDIVARSAGPASREQLMVMLRALLADRFKLTIRREREQMRIYAVVVASDGPRLTGARDADRGMTLTRADRGWTFTSASMADLADYLSKAGPIGVPVVDATNLRGRFDFTFAFVPPRQAAVVQTGPTGYIDALAELGLRLESRTIPMDVLVVEHAERIPTPN